TRLALGDDRNSSTRWLTAREQEVLEKLTLGMSVREIAETIGRSPHTVHDHVKSLHRKLNATSRGELVARALGYIDAQGRTAEAKAPLGDRAKSEVERAVREGEPAGATPVVPARQTARRLNAP
ncbi:MAG: helix-turn-helix transcriptional regulator, partial [Planctomycetota bacterium]